MDLTDQSMFFDGTFDELAEVGGRLMSVIFEDAIAPENSGNGLDSSAPGDWAEVSTQTKNLTVPVPIETEVVRKSTGVTYRVKAIRDAVGMTILYCLKSNRMTVTK